VMILVYLVLIELGKRWFYHLGGGGKPLSRPVPPRLRRINHRASRWSVSRRVRAASPRR
jgi:hypothetical protein